MAPSATRRPSWRTVTPMLAIAAFGLVACSNSQESSEVKGTTPPVWTGSAAPAESSGSAEEAPAGNSIPVQLKDPSGAQVGTATISESGEKVQITVDAHGLKPGFHGLHVHEFGKCEADSTAPSGGERGNFLSAGGHLQVGDKNTHPASGDLTSLEVGQDGTAKLVTTTDSVTLDQLKGKALMIHGGSDNFGNIPDRYSAEGKPGPDAKTLSTGDAGDRVACGVIG
ncbi:superoxide dismutase[Cu-Zn] [Nocardia vermiculata]|uniref:Superoxide dismutase [Cu-Zn] n=1 Tax=Nocardia vermiculata TaxID=257274 RepID=A0A846XZZ4_9NOCA|nr:superoxide dismutase family protein [Nocardia vermiculata]NKY52613.1 superoxide dismutase family protein [Nocardia vermiculata]